MTANFLFTFFMILHLQIIKILIHIRRRAEEATGRQGETERQGLPLSLSIFSAIFLRPTEPALPLPVTSIPVTSLSLHHSKSISTPKKGAKNHRPQENPAKRWSKKQTEIPVTGGRTRTGTASIVLRFCQDYCHNPWCATCLSQKNPACSVNIREYSHSCAFV
ncbi:MAG TPA: hypothetical protein IAA52_11005 [Candidatus Pullichristensenella stercorigallinarum]|uniref:Uncharacterized protein n=1 Tax=Candidatus Pullichristensenella stercorigallinarum TaxID=2840909 RepID=A0A9D1CYK2_9FIRM|nr:hypothetical protein [Candidatus Pullichristensenella stercorigallinarum]